MQKLLIVTPVYNDWRAFGQLMQEIERAFPREDFDVDVLAVDDHSADVPAIVELGGSVAEITVLRLAYNVGHQRAIAVGLVEAEMRGDDLVAVMDSDGEDLPAELRRMLDAFDPGSRTAIVAQRGKRSEGLMFRLFYFVYVRLFKMLTGHRIDFGNFSLLTNAHIRRLVHNPHIWNNYAATLIQTKMPIRRLPTTRGTRYAGRSHLRLVGLINHGLGAISVFTDTVLTRVLIASFCLFATSVVTIITVLMIRLLTTSAIPGWTTNVLGFAFLLSAQAFMLPILLSFVVLGNRSAVQAVPLERAKYLIEGRELLYRRDDGEEGVPG